MKMMMAMLVGGWVAIYGSFLEIFYQRKSVQFDAGSAVGRGPGHGRFPLTRQIQTSMDKDVISDGRGGINCILQPNFLNRPRPVLLLRHAQGTPANTLSIG